MKVADYSQKRKAGNKSQSRVHFKGQSYLLDEYREPGHTDLCASAVCKFDKWFLPLWTSLLEFIFNVSTDKHYIQQCIT